MDLEALRTALHDAVDQILNDFLTGDDMTPHSTAQAVPTTENPVFTRGAVEVDWTYTWPGDEGPEKFHETSLWDVVSPHNSYRARLAWGKRRSWGKDDRRRAIVFGQTGPNTFYPWTEFVETDTGYFAAPIPNPEHPRKIITQSDPLPGRYRAARVERSDLLFEQITNGPTLRLVLSSEDEEDMMRHGYWVARLRNRL